jgi:hypothetical protein
VVIGIVKVLSRFSHKFIILYDPTLAILVLSPLNLQCQYSSYLATILFLGYLFHIFTPILSSTAPCQRQDEELWNKVTNAV